MTESDGKRPRYVIVGPRNRADDWCRRMFRRSVNEAEGLSWVVSVSDHHGTEIARRLRGLAPGGPVQIIDQRDATTMRWVNVMDQVNDMVASINGTVAPGPRWAGHSMGFFRRYLRLDIGHQSSVREAFERLSEAGLVFPIEGRPEEAGAFTLWPRVGRYGDCGLNCGGGRFLILDHQGYLTLETDPYPGSPGYVMLKPEGTEHVD